MLGSLHKKGKMYYVVFDEGRDPVTQKRKQKWVSLKTSDKKTAEAKYSEMVKKINTEEYTEPTKMQLAEYLEYWLANYAKHSVRPSTYGDYECIVRQHFIPALGKYPLAKLSPLHIQEFLNQKLATDLSSSTVRKLYAVLRKALNNALKWHLITINPCLAVDPPRIEKYKAVVYSPEQLEALFGAASSEQIYLPVLISATCGLRRGEVCGLRWSDIDLERSVLFVRNSLDWQGGRLTLVPLKTASSERAVKLPQLTLTALKTEKSRQAEDKLRAGGLYDDQNFVWAWDDGRPHDPFFLYKHFVKTIQDYNDALENDEDLSEEQKAAAKLPTIRFHDLRHSHATALLLAGVPVKVISERLGHSSITITQDIYSHVLPEMQQQAADEIDKMFTKKQRQN
jgi:integrase